MLSPAVIFNRLWTVSGLLVYAMRYDITKEVSFRLLDDHKATIYKQLHCQDCCKLVKRCSDCASVLVPHGLAPDLDNLRCRARPATAAPHSRHLILDHACLCESCNLAFPQRVAIAAILAMCNSDCVANVQLCSECVVDLIHALAFPLPFPSRPDNMAPHPCCDTRHLGSASRS